MNVPAKYKEAVQEQTTESSDELHQYLTFRLRDEMYAIGILRIKEILEYNHVTKVPMVPAFIHGVINLRGSVVPVIDMAIRFNEQKTEVEKRTCIVIVEVDVAEGQQDIGIIVDAVSEVLTINPDEIEKTPSFGAKIRMDFIAGMGKVDGDFVIILAVDSVLSVEELSMLQDAKRLLEKPANRDKAKDVPVEREP